MTNPNVLLDIAKDREFPLSAANFQAIKAAAYRLTGINLSDQKQNMVYGRLTRRLRALNFAGFDEYCALIGAEFSPEHREFINAITTNLTSFFRESHHFDFLRKQLLPELLDKKRSSKKIRIWSAGCSTGEEPFSIAMVISAMKELNNWDVKILATDLDTNVLNKGREAIYPIDRKNSIPVEYQCFLQSDKVGNNFRIKPEVSRLVSFKQLNLLQAWPIKNPMDVIICRNVVIYFDLKTQQKLFDRYANQLTEKGILIIGHSENLHKISDRFTGLGRTLYRRNR